MEAKGTMKTVFFDNFEGDANKTYPDNWIVEENCKHPNHLGWVDNQDFYILFEGNKHIPLTPDLKDFSLEFTLHGDRFFVSRELHVYFHYNTEKRTGYCLKYSWSSSGKVHYDQEPVEKYKLSWFKYNGTGKLNTYVLLSESEVAAFIPDISVEQQFKLEVTGNEFVFSHDSKIIGECEEDENDLLASGAIAFDREHHSGIISMESIKIYSKDDFPRNLLLPEQKIEFPDIRQGIISPFIFHFSVKSWGKLKILNTMLTGGPSKTPVYPDIDRCRFNEKMHSPYIRLENTAGNKIGKYYLYTGSVGLNEYHWNFSTSVMNPADTECPLERKIIIRDLPDDTKFYIGYEHYTGEDTICLAGGPTEALISREGKVVYVGDPLLPGTLSMELASPVDKQIVNEIPKDVPEYANAVKFAQNNHFFIENEPVKFNISVRGKQIDVEDSELEIKVTLQNAFKEPLGGNLQFTLKSCSGILPGTVEWETGFFELSDLEVGVYHLQVELWMGNIKQQELSKAFEVMPEDREAEPAPVVSGLPRLFPNILSGIKNEHFYPWASYTSDIIHYSYGGNNLFKVAREMQPWKLYPVYGRKWYCWLKPWRTIFTERGIDANLDLIEKSDACLNTFQRLDLWKIGSYRKPEVFVTLLDYLKSDNFEDHEDSYIYELVVNKERGINKEQFLSLVDYHWKSWIKFYTHTVMNKILPGFYEKIKKFNPDCDVYEFCPVMPTYASVYKAGYFPYCFGKNLRSRIDKFIPGPNGFEDYPYSSKYPIARGIYQLASCKLEAPKMQLNPEMFGINGETRDARVVFSHPPYGQSDPPYGFMTKQFYEYSFATVWFDSKGFNFWNDHGYYIKTWDRENYDEMLKAYSFISRVVPLKPLRTAAFVFSIDACFSHPDYYEQDEELIGGGDMYNTAEEAVAFAYDRARNSGQSAGFVVKMEDIDKVSYGDVSMLVLPPLCGISDAQKNAIRKLHEQGVSLLGFEDADGLDDLFGVKKSDKSIQVKNIEVADKEVLKDISELTETTDHPLCETAYLADTADVLLKGDCGAPVLVMNRTKYGRTAFYTLPPTVVKRSKEQVHTYGQESISELINRSVEIIMNHIADYQVTTSEGKAIAFHEKRGDVYIIIEEDAWPQPGRKITPLVTVKMPDLKPEQISCNKEFSIVKITQKKAQIRLLLMEHESVIIKINS